MKPEVDEMLRVLAGQCGTEITPQLPSSYGQGQMSLISLLMLFAAQEYERGAQIRVAENDDLRALFREVAPIVTEAKLAQELQTAGNGAEASLAVSALDQANAHLRRLLIRLQEHIEPRSDAEARAAERRIWRVLIASADRRLLRLA